MSETFATLVKLFAQVVQTLKARCLDISGASDPRAQTPEMSTMGPYTMRYKRSVHRVAGGSVCGSCCVNICQNKLLHLSWEVLKGCSDWKALWHIYICKGHVNFFPKQRGHTEGFLR